MRKLNKSEKNILILSLGATLFFVGILSRFIGGEIIINTISMLNQGMPFSDIKGVVNAFISGETIELIPSWVSLSLVVIGALLVYVSSFEKINPDKEIKDILKKSYWKDFQKTIHYSKVR